MICGKKLWTFDREIAEYPFLHQRKLNLSVRQWYIYFSLIRIQTWIIAQSLGYMAIFQQSDIQASLMKDWSEVTDSERGSDNKFDLQIISWFIHFIFSVNFGRRDINPVSNIGYFAWSVISKSELRYSGFKSRGWKYFSIFIVFHTYYWYVAFFLLVSLAGCIFMCNSGKNLEHLDS